MKHIKIAYDELLNRKPFFKQSLELRVERYIKLLLWAGLFAAVFSVILSFISALWFDIIRNVTVDYIRLTNYSLGIASSIFFAYLFIGTIGVFILAYILSKIIRKSLGDSLKMVFFALIPVLLFGWLHHFVAISLLIWSAHILIEQNK